ncbi:hypothetical protein HID58_048776 [Brassica napus]|uniref:Uncharacterized protein n=1 Tax=Brassica napus TaxID=3708 RepID=A0ABQ8B395_BRANA|nr:hypothetical protein HID58_048776 [Brassica napus]
MVFREWDPGRKRVGIAHEIPNLHQDYSISKQGKIHVILGLQVAMAWIINSIRDLFGFTWRVDKGINDLLEVGSGKIIAILEDNQIGEREEKKQGPRKVLFKNQTVAGRSIMKKLVQGFVLPHKRTSAEAAKAGIRAHPNHDTFMDQSNKEVKLRWQILHLVSLNLQCKMEWKETTRICWVKDDHWCLLRIWNKDTIVLSLLLFFKYWNKNESGFVAVLSCLLTRRMMYATGGGPKHIWFSIWFGLVVLDYRHTWDKSASQQTVQMGRDNDNRCSLCYFYAVFCYHSSLSITVCNVILSMFGNTIDFAGFYFGCNMSLSRTYFRWGIWSLSNITSSKTSLDTGQYGMFSLWMHLTLILWSVSKIRSNIGVVIVGFDVRLHTKVWCAYMLESSVLLGNWPHLKESLLGTYMESVVRYYTMVA